MRRIRESFEFLTGISNHNNELINKGKTPKGFQLLDNEPSKTDKRKQSVLGSLINWNKNVSKLQHMPDQVDPNSVEPNDTPYQTSSPKAMRRKDFKRSLKAD